MLPECSALTARTSLLPTGKSQHKHTRVTYGIRHPKDPCAGQGRALLAQSDLSKVECKFACKRFVYYLVLAQEVQMYLRSSQICLSTDSLVIKESSSCRNASLNCELDIYLRSSVLLLSYITLQWQTRSFASSCSSYPSPPCFYIPERLDWSPSPTKLSSSMLQGQPFLAVHRQAVSAAATFRAQPWQRSFRN